MDKELEALYQKAMAAARTPAGKKYARKVSRIHGLAEHEVLAHVKAFDRDAQEPVIPNLDRMDREQLMTFWARYHRPTKKIIAELFPGWNQREGLRAVVVDLANYASNKATEKFSKAMDDKQAASIYRKICEKIYGGLPSFAQFRRSMPPITKGEIISFGKPDKWDKR